MIPANYNASLTTNGVAFEAVPGDESFDADVEQTAVRGDETCKHPKRLFPERMYRCIVFVQADESGGFFATAPQLPGAVGEGESVEEAIDDIRIALATLIQEYLAAGSIPWIPLSELPTPTESVIERRLLVNV